MSTIIAIKNSGAKGKTETVRQFANLLLHSYPSCTPLDPLSAIVPSTGDFRLIVEVNGKVIGIESQGDPNTNLKKRLNELLHIWKCDIIICTCRTKGDTWYDVRNLRINTIWTSTHDISGQANQAIANSLKGKNILELLQGLTLI